MRADYCSFWNGEEFVSDSTHTYVSADCMFLRSWSKCVPVQIYAGCFCFFAVVWFGFASKLLLYFSTLAFNSSL